MAKETELQALHESEFIPGGHPVDGEIEAALRAAVASGYALGLREAADLIEEFAQAAAAAKAASDVR